MSPHPDTPQKCVHSYRLHPPLNARAHGRAVWNMTFQPMPQGYAQPSKERYEPTTSQQNDLPWFREK